LSENVTVTCNATRCDTHLPKSKLVLRAEMNWMFRTINRVTQRWIYAKCKLRKTRVF